MTARAFVLGIFVALSAVPAVGAGPEPYSPGPDRQDITVEVIEPASGAPAPGGPEAAKTEASDVVGAALYSPFANPADPTFNRASAAKPAEPERSDWPLALAVASVLGSFAVFAFVRRRT